MGNCLAINFNISCDKLSSLCFREEGATERKNLVDFQNDWEQLKAARTDVKHKIEMEERQLMRPLEEVNRWLLRITILEDHAENLIVDFTKESANKCFCGFAQKNCKKYYEFKRAMAPLAKEVADLLKLKPGIVCERLPTIPIQKQPQEAAYGMESMCSEVLRQIQDDKKVGMIGLYGMGGVGKTTLLKEINNHLVCNAEPKEFDLLLWIVVSKNPNLADIQNKFGEKLGLSDISWNGKSQEEKALRIFAVLDRMKYIILLDDVWERFDLTKMGIPLPSITNKAKIIFTTRSKTLCGEMKARWIQVKCLTKMESWNLFLENVGEATLNAHPDIPGLAEVVSKECKGLPLALKTVGRAMTCKTSPHCWNLAIKLLKRNAADFSGMGDEVFSILKYSYDSLPSDSLRSCFLYCSLYPEDHLIDKEDIIEKWICEGYLVKFGDVSDARHEGYDYISTLLNASLLEECSAEQFKMHDVIRDTAIWIASEFGENKEKFIVQTRCGLSQMPNVLNLKGVGKMSLMHNDICELIEMPHCQKTSTMFVASNKLRLITGRFFKSVQNLKVLDLSSNRKLQALPSEIGELVSLQYLNLSNTGIEELPPGFKKLRALEYLNLERTQTRQNIPQGVLRCCKKLRVLKLCEVRFNELSIYNSNGPTPTGTLVEELKSLECLKELTIGINNEISLNHFTSSSMLMGITTKLSLFNFNRTRFLDMSFLNVMTHLDKLVFWKLRSLETINLGKKIFLDNLSYLRMYECSMLKDLTWIAFAPNIKYIFVDNCPSMKELVGGSAWDENVNNRKRPTPFAELATLELKNLPKLESIYPTALPFPCLKQLTVLDCSDDMKKLPFDSSIRNEGHITIEGRKCWWDNLEWEDEATKGNFSCTFKPFKYWTAKPTLPSKDVLLEDCVKAEV